jgi:hypothetical protein
MRTRPIKKTNLNMISLIICILFSVSTVFAKVDPKKWDTAIAQDSVQGHATFYEMHLGLFAH